ncbi:hypothetical protein [Salipiger thiooxidans]|uniref:hypothetical protein n=1 Tax=Salipiger thiooxidans TaxID=282683 RepID=UPI001CD1952A|nr:hypothetical protein [Salipiger thiooxidans]MCA0846062.1 hypothetical protein [Salipiger thiooxidans]
MTVSPTFQMVMSCLKGAGYQSVSTPFRVASVEFDFPAALRGDTKRSNDLVLAFDLTEQMGETPNVKRIRQKIEALGRALDITQSKLVLTAILVGNAESNEVDELAETCRVLTVEEAQQDVPDSSGTDDTSWISDRIRVLLPLVLPRYTEGPQISGLSALDELKATAEKSLDKKFVEDILLASEHGEEAVVDRFVQTIERAILQEGQDD